MKVVERDQDGRETIKFWGKENGAYNTFEQLQQSHGTQDGLTQSARKGSFQVLVVMRW